MGTEFQSEVGKRLPLGEAVLRLSQFALSDENLQAIFQMSRSVRTNCWLLSIVSIAPIEFMTELRLFRGLKKSNSRATSSSDNRLPHDPKGDLGK